MGVSADPRRPAAGSDSRLEADWIDSALGKRSRQRPRSPVDRARSLLLLGLLGAAALVLCLRWLSIEPHLPVAWRVGPQGGIELESSSDAALRGAIGQRLQALVLADGRRIEAGTALLSQSPRWIVDDGARQQVQAQRVLLAQAVRQPTVTLQFSNGTRVEVEPRPRGLAGLGAVCWGVGALALALYLTAVVVWLSEQLLPSALYGLLALSQCINLLLIGAEWLPGLGPPAGLAQADLPLRLLADAVAAAALVHVLLVYPQAQARRAWLAPGVWTLALAALAWAAWQPPAGLWWWAQGLLLGLGLAASMVLQPVRREGGPLAAMLQQLTLAGMGTLLLLSAAIATAQHEHVTQNTVASVGSTIWYVFFASLLILGPFLTRSKQVLREFALLAGIATLASSLDLLFVALLAIGPLPAMLLAVAVSVLVYLLARPWLVDQLAGSGVLSAERMFDSLYRVARALEQAPEQAGRQLTSLLREVFDPLEVVRSGRTVSRIRVANDGSTLVVPIPQLAGPPGTTEASGTIVLRLARGGRRLFTVEDMQLAERLIEQLRRAVAYDRAVEHGRTEERMRIAQDLHDDIGARLLTLMYKAPNSEIEEYIRHTLQDLKTLTRGLAAANHRLSHAAAEWKADITQRLGATGCDLHWSFSADRDLMLTVVQWSGLTRVLRELVNNIIAHAQATQVEINAVFDRGNLTLIVSDDGQGRAPEQWSHGLGLGGVRKRVKLLGGQVQWLERGEGGIRCEVHVPLAGGPV